MSIYIVSVVNKIRSSSSQQFEKSSVALFWNALSPHALVWVTGTSVELSLGEWYFLFSWLDLVRHNNLISLWRIISRNFYFYLVLSSKLFIVYHILQLAYVCKNCNELSDYELLFFFHLHIRKRFINLILLYFSCDTSKLCLQIIAHSEKCLDYFKLCILNHILILFSL